MIWMEEKNVIICRQILAERPYQHKKYTGELTRTWNLITDALSELEGFPITSKSLRDHFASRNPGILYDSRDSTD